MVNRWDNYTAAFKNAAVFFLEAGKIFQKNGGHGDDTRFYITETRRSAQFSFGQGNLNPCGNSGKRFLENNFLLRPCFVSSGR